MPSDCQGARWGGLAAPRSTFVATTYVDLDSRCARAAQLRYSAIVMTLDFTFSKRDVAFTFLASIPIGAIAAAAVGALSSLGIPIIGGIALIAGIVGLGLGPLAASGGYLGYRLARAGKLRSPWLLAAVVALGSGVIMSLFVVCLTEADMGGFVSETINGHPSNPWLDSLPLYPIVFVAAFVPAYLWFVVYASFRRRHPLSRRVPAAAQPEI
jgi:hypothetical protein